MIGCNPRAFRGEKSVPGAPGPNTRRVRTECYSKILVTGVGRRGNTREYPGYLAKSHTLPCISTYGKYVIMALHLHSLQYILLPPCFLHWCRTPSLDLSTIGIALVRFFVFVFGIVFYLSHWILSTTETDKSVRGTRAGQRIFPSAYVRCTRNT